MMTRKTLSFVCIIAVALIAGCAGPVRKKAVPKSITHKATIPELSDIRYRMGIDDQAMIREGLELLRLERAYLKANEQEDQLPPVFYLAISGGGDKGAFGAGLLNGWTVAGDRPEFKLVTGVSTGALIAPFAFLGPAYDDRLKEFYTNISPEDIMKRRNILAAVTNDAMADNRPLWDRLEKEVDRAFLDAIAAEYLKGRVLVIATVDLDARHSVIWSMTKIAANQDPKALHLFRAIMVASAAVPGTFPPVMIDVEVDGKVYQEMHVDGGTMSQVFIYPPSVSLVKEIGVRQRTAYVIRNSKLGPQWADVDRRTMSIALRAVTTLIHTQGIGDLYKIYLTCQRDEVDFNLAAIPPSFDVPHREQFDTEYMRALFDLGYKMAAQHYPWQKEPPGYQKLNMIER
jgi:predicted acylesterase/phospholipase RssA